MAFKDLTKVFYDGKIKVDYKDKAHSYYAYPRIDFEKDVTDRKAWGKATRPKGATSLIEATLEKSGLMRWPLGLALRELYGFYDFTNETGQKMTGFSKDIGTMWDADGFTKQLDQTAALPLIISANEASNKKKKKGADIGSVVHDAIEHYVKNLEFDIGEAYMWSIKEAWPLPDQGKPDEFVGERNLALKAFQEDTDQARLAFAQFVNWWEKTSPILYGAEDLLYSIQYNVSGTYDACLGIKGEHHPILKQKAIVRCTTDWKTSNASKSKQAGMPEGINYQYFVQSALYELMRREMGEEPADDLLIVSARKDGGFSLIYASELGFFVEDLLEVAKAVILIHQFKEKAIKGLNAHAEEKK